MKKYDIAHTYAHRPIRPSLNIGPKLTRMIDYDYILTSPCDLNDSMHAVTRQCSLCAIFMTALWNRAGRPLYFHPVVSSSSVYLCFFSSPNLSRRRLD